MTDHYNASIKYGPDMSMANKNLYYFQRCDLKEAKPQIITFAAPKTPKYHRLFPKGDTSGRFSLNQLGEISLQGDKRVGLIYSDFYKFTVPTTEGKVELQWNGANDSDGSFKWQDPPKAVKKGLWAHFEESKTEGFLRLVKVEVPVKPRAEVPEVEWTDT